MLQVTITPLEPIPGASRAVSGSVSGPVSGVSAVSSVSAVSAVSAVSSVSSAATKASKHEGWPKKHGFLQRLLNLDN